MRALRMEKFDMQTSTRLYLTENCKFYNSLKENRNLRVTSITYFLTTIKIEKKKIQVELKGSITKTYLRLPSQPLR